MEVLATLTERSLGISDKGYVTSNHRERKAARAVVFDGDKAAILSVEKHGFYKIPGGGVEEGEDVKEALHREAAEEAGCEVEIGEPVGCVVEHRAEQNLVQTSYCYLAKVTTHLPATGFTEDESADGFKLRWVPVEEAKRLFANAAPGDYAGKFMSARDKIFFEKAISFLE